MKALLLSFLAGSCLAGCSPSGAGAVDGGADLALGPAVTHLGPRATTCCMVTHGADEVLYLANPSPSRPDAQGRDLPPSGELHLANARGDDLTLASSVPAYGYAFSPDGGWALFLSKTPTQRYALDLMPLERPELHLAPPVVAVADGMQDAALGEQAFFTPSGRYLVAGVLPKGVAVSPDLHVIELASGRDVFSLTNGAFDYQEQVTLDDTMIFANSTASTMPGVPSVEGLYVTSLAAGPSVKPALVDTHVTNFATTGDGGALVYARENGDLVMFGLRDRDVVPLASGVVAFSLGASPRGPVVYTTGDGALHVRPLVAPATVTTVAGAIDPFSPIALSPDGQRLYWFKNVSSQNGTGDLYTAPLPPLPAAAPSLVATDASTRDLHFVGDQLVFVANVDATGATGDVAVAALDGSGLRVVARGAATDDFIAAFPADPPPAPTGAPRDGPIDLGPATPPPIFAHLTRATEDAAERPIDGSRPIVGALALGRADLLAGGAETELAAGVQAGRFALSDDGYVLAFIGGAQYSRIAVGWVGALGLTQTRPDVDVAPVVPALDGVSELGPIVARSFFVDAPMANPNGIYFVRY